MATVLHIADHHAAKVQTTLPGRGFAFTRPMNWRSNRVISERQLADALRTETASLSNVSNGLPTAVRGFISGRPLRVGSTHSWKLQRTLGVTDPGSTGQMLIADVFPLLRVRPLPTLKRRSRLVLRMFVDEPEAAYSKFHPRLFANS